MSSLVYLGLLSSAWILFLAYRRARRLARGKLPPGPPADPIIGHLRVFPQKNQGQKFYEWSKIYGDVIHLDILGKSVVVLNSREAAMDLLHKRGSKYSDRPDFPAYNLLGWDDQLVFLRFGEDFHKQRRLIQKPLARQACLAYRPVMLEQAHILLKNLLKTPDAFEAHLRRYNAAVTLNIIYGRSVESNTDSMLDVADQVNVVLTDMSKAVILDLFPSLKHLPAWVPGAWFVRYARDKGFVKERMQKQPFEEVQKQMAAGIAQPCFVSSQLEEMDKNDNDHEKDIQMLKVAAGHMWTGGEETTWSTLLILLLAIVRHPEAAKKAQEEIERAIGQDRLPTLDDYDSLPYIGCLIQETMRWHSALPLGIPHRSMEDDIYRDMLIPKDATVVVNTQALALDESVYKDPHKFWPDRYLPEHGEPLPTGFGFGRRICPGKHLAESSLWLVAASILAVFDVDAVKDKHGRDLVPELAFTDAITSHPEHFKCRIRPRSKNAEMLILRG